MKSITDYKKDATLNKQLRYPEGIMSRRDWLKMMQVKGWEAEERTRRNLAAEEKLSEWLRREKMQVPFGNINYPSTKFYLEEKARLEAGIYKTEYALKNGNSIFDITKTEYDHFKALQLEDDILSEKMEITHKIEAGTATNEEVNAYMQEDFAHFQKYCPD